MVKRKLTIPSKTAKVRDIVEFYLHSADFARLSGISQKKYEKELHKAVKTTIESKALGDYKASTLKARHTNQRTSSGSRQGYTQLTIVRLPCRLRGGIV